MIEYRIIAYLDNASGDLIGIWSESTGRGSKGQQRATAKLEITHRETETNTTWKKTAMGSEGSSTGSSTSWAVITPYWLAAVSISE